MDINHVAQTLGDASYGLLAINGTWGLYCAVRAWRLLSALRFRNRQEQDDFIDEFEQLTASGNMADIDQLCEDDSRAVVQMAHIALSQAMLPLPTLRQNMSEQFQNEVLSRLERLMSWIATVIKSGPLLGLFGTVLGMMAAFGRIGSGEKVEPHHIAHEISIALVCTAMGLVTAIPLNYVLSSLRNRLQEFQEVTGAGINRILQVVKRGSGAPAASAAFAGGRS